MKELIEILRGSPEAEYSLTDLQNMRAFPWVRNYRTLRKIVEADRLGANLLKARVSGTEAQKRYTLKKENIISYLETYGTAMMSLVRRPKRKNGKKEKSGKVEAKGK